MFKTEKFQQMNYLIKLPNDFSADKIYPVLIFMHGAGTRGNNIEQVRENPFFRITEQYNDFPFIVFAPQCHCDTWFDMMETVNAFAKYIGSLKYVDTDSIYLMGASMGGYAVWQMAMSNPSLYAAIVPICGSGMYWNASRIFSIPVWAFHGDSDTVVKTEESIKMVNEVNNAGGNAKLTIYENCGHDAWSQTYSNEKVFEWLLCNKKKPHNIADTGLNDSAIYG